MGCCLALAYLVAVVRRAWHAVVPGAPVAVATFAPPARRPAPGGSVAIHARPAAASPRGSWAPALVVAGLAWFVVGIVGMHVLGWFAWAETSLLADTAFHTSGLWLAASGLAIQVVRA